MFEDVLMKIYVNGRTVNLARPVKIGTQGENLAVLLTFYGIPHFLDGQLVTLNWLTDGDEPVGDICALDYSDEFQAYGMFVETGLTQFAGRQVTAYLEVASGDIIWRSEPFLLDATALPEVESTLEPKDPTIIQQVKDALEQANAAATRAEEAAKRAEEALPDFGVENAGKLLYIGPDGTAIPLALGAGLEIRDGGIGASAVCMLGGGAPTGSTEGELGRLYMDTLTGDVYKCTGIVNESSITVSTDEGLPNVYIKASNGSAVSIKETSSMYGKYTTSDYLNVETLKGKTVKISCCMLDIVGFAIYNSNKSFITGVSGTDISNNSSGTAIKHTENYEYTLPDDAAYIRYSVHNPYVITDAKVVYDVDVYSFEWEHIAIRIGDNEGDAFSAARGIALEKKANDPVFTLPAKSIAVVGHEWNMYFHNIFDYMTDKYFIRCGFSPSIGSAKMLNDVLRFTPTEDDLGIHELSLKLYGKTGDTDMWRLIKTHTVSVNVIQDISLSDKKVLFIGDSLTQNGTYPAEIQHHLSAGGLTSIGTRSATVVIDDQSLTVHHEGRAGWASYDYTRTKEGSKTIDHPFWNSETGAFDFAHYMESQGYDNVDIVCLALGTNGVDKTDDVCYALDVMIESIHAYNPAIKVLVSLITLPGTQDGCGVNNGMQNSALLKMQTLRLNRAYLEKYQNKTQNVDVAELYFALDTFNDYNTVEQPLSARNPRVITRQNGNVHPSVYGYLKFADVWYNNILYHLTN